MNIWPILAALFLGGIFAVHLFWKRKFSVALQENEIQLARERELQREAVAEAEARQSAMLNSMIEGFLLLDNDGRIRLANRALENLFGVTSNIYGKNIIEAFRNHELATLIEHLKSERQIVNFEIQLPGIESRWFQVNAASLLDDENNTAGSILVFHDLTRLKQLENTRQEFVANVSHELRTPLSMIKGYVETLLSGAKDDPIIATKFLQTIEKHADRLTFLIEDLLTISKLESGQIVLNCELMELRPAVEKVHQDLRSRADEKNITVENQIPLGLSVFADIDRLEQVFWNLIENAIKYGRVNGKVIIGGQPTENKKIELWIRDDGPGIPVEAKERIFERFYRVDKARSREQGGTGLGLSIVKHVVQCHGGEVWVESESGRGSSFHFTLCVVQSLHNTTVTAI